MVTVVFSDGAEPIIVRLGSATGAAVIIVRFGSCIVAPILDGFAGFDSSWYRRFVGIIKNLDTIWFSVRDMERAVAFYSNVFGLETGHSSPHWTSMKIGEFQIGLHGPSDPTLPQPVAGWVVSVVTDDLKALRDMLLGAGADVDDGYHDTPRGAVLSFRDPDGNRLQAMQLGMKASEIV